MHSNRDNFKTFNNFEIIDNNNKNNKNNKNKEYKVEYFNIEQNINLNKMENEGEYITLKVKNIGKCSWPKKCYLTSDSNNNDINFEKKLINKGNEVEPNETIDIKIKLNKEYNCSLKEEYILTYYIKDKNDKTLDKNKSGILHLINQNFNSSQANNYFNNEESNNNFNYFNDSQDNYNNKNNFDNNEEISEKIKKNCLDIMNDEFQNLLSTNQIAQTARKNKYDIEKTRTELYENINY